MLIEISALFALYFGLFGLLIGSFLNVCVYRIPRRESVVVGRSHCPDCGHTLAPADLIPVISYLALGRRCRYCRQPISPRYATVELLTALIFALSGFALCALGMLRDWPAWGVILVPFIDMLVLSFIWVRVLIAYDRRIAQTGRHNLWKTFLFFLIGDLLHLSLFWLISR